ncbi:hypothetical protein FA13DRAFT_1776324 [Coprinellus micaceus]|uniref:NACHT domain-containing protein n=1 Tax=Coprinellus micaceus TaxID=71717 RepID=A0A4Y7T1H7_COPMI|nr:hypothetical protein FA13DRAFT_1776324 [Coprinellus micaceus]
MSTTTSVPRGVGTSSTVAREPITTNVAGNYLDYSTVYHNTNITIASRSRIEPFDRLLSRVAHGAVHDSAERGPYAPKCHPKTRTAVQKDIMGWIRCGEQDETPRRILWLSGPAGSGKTAIAGTIADQCYKQGLLAASFFFSAFARSMDRRLNKQFIPTLVYRLIQHKSVVGLKEEVLAVIEDDPWVFEKHLDQQLEELILKPLRKIAGRSNCGDWPLVIVVDGLDECQGHSESDIGPGGDTHTPGASAQQEVLSALSRACTDSAFPFRIIIASRPEPAIRHFFSTPQCPTLNVFLDNKYDPDSDIRLFLEAKFSDLRRRFKLPSTWAAKGIIDILVKEASGQFIYAATVIRFLDNSRIGSPQQLLTRVLEWRNLSDSRPFAPLDLLYHRILRTSPDPLMAVKWICFIRAQQEDAYNFPYVRGVLESYPGETEHVLGTLTSLVGLVDGNEQPGFQFYHKSLFDFLQDPHRSSDLHVNDESLLRFTGDLYYQTLQARGPQFRAAGRSTDHRPLTLLDLFTLNLVHHIDPYRRYTPGDVEWWLLNLHESSSDKWIPSMFSSIHRQCKWYHCLPACGIWREGILRYCTEHGWRVPTTKELLQGRFMNVSFDPLEPADFPLRHPHIEATRSLPAGLADMYASGYIENPAKFYATRGLG